MNLNYPNPRLVTKPWGSETWEILSADFCIKTIRLIAGSKTSFQWHRQKEEINFIESGEAEVWMEDDSGNIIKHFLKKGDSFFVPATRKHRVIAITDLEMFEVSNEFVDDVVRIHDEFGRGDGKISVEHQVPAVLILAAGLGSRLKQYTLTKNKALLLIANQAVISHIINKFPPNYEIVVAVGYQKDSLVSYCRLAHPERSFIFVEAEGWDNPETDPGHSAFVCKQYLQRPFYLAAVDSLIEKPVPHMDGNWIGTYPTDCPEKYATVDVVDGKIAQITNKGTTGFSNAFIGLAAIRDYEIFWAELGKSASHELIAAWRNPSAYPSLRAKELRWFDAGNLDDLRVARKHFGSDALSSPKNLGETTYLVGRRVLKFHPDEEITKNRLSRAVALKGLVPENVVADGKILAYDWQEGKNLYHHSPAVCRKFLRVLGGHIPSDNLAIDPAGIQLFYFQKTAKRLALFAEKYGEGYLTEGLIINGVSRRAPRDLLTRMPFSRLSSNSFYPLFHGDLHFDNIIYDEAKDRFVYIDWRESFAGNTQNGDLYYDLGKLYAGTIVPFELLKSDFNVGLSEGSSHATYHYDVPDSLRDFRIEYEEWISSRFDLERVKIVAGIALLNIAPLHTDAWNKVLLFKGIELLDDILS